MIVTSTGVFWIYKKLLIKNSDRNRKKKILNIHTEPQKPSKIVKAILSKENKTGAVVLPDVKLYYEAIVIKALWYWYKHTHT